MSIYKNRAEFISRTLSFLDKYEKGCNFEKTFFLNCCLGLLVIPQQCAVQDSNLYVSNIVDYDNWGIDKSKILVNSHAHNRPKNSAENIARHIRNSIAHYRFDIIKVNENVETIKEIHLQDFKKKKGKEQITFDLTLSFDDFKKFVLKYAKEQKKKLETI